MTTQTGPYPQAEVAYAIRNQPPAPTETAALGPQGPPAPAPSQSTPAATTKPAGLGIACSGGGIRSAAFCLGALQALTREGRLQQADYLAAVSGGSYIASAYAMVARHSDPELLAQRPPFEPGSPEEAYVRNNCSYLAAGLYGKARLAASVLVGVLSNIVVFGVFLSLLRPLGWLYARWHPGLREGAATVAVGDVRSWAVASAWLVGAGAALAVIARLFHPSWRVRRALNRSAIALVSASLAAVVVGVVLPWLLLVVRDMLGGRDAILPVETPGADTKVDKGRSNLWTTTAVSAVAVGSGALVQLTSALRSAFSLGQEVAERVRWFTKLRRGLRTTLLYTAGALAAPLVVLAGALLVLSDGAATGLTRAEAIRYGAFVVGAVLLLRYADVTSWSMHPFYRRRLASAFAVKRTRTSNGTEVAREIDYNTRLHMADFAPNDMARRFPEVVVCAAANVSDPGATPPGSAITSFVFSPTVVGGPLVGGMATAEYQDRVGAGRSRDVTLPAAIAISGAALSPSMGKMTKAPLRALLALANVRLGVWMPNPGRFGEGAGGLRIVAHNPGPKYLLYEVFGRHKLTGKYLYLSDGGHYENLGLVELLRRRCTTVVALDAAGGPPTSLTTLSEAVALARAEANVSINIDPTVIVPAEGTTTAAVAVATGTISYPEGTTGTLVFVKAAVTADSPWDVKAYAERDLPFPAHSTAEQLYTGERFEAYRVLGYAAGTAAAEAMDEIDGSGETDGEASGDGGGSEDGGASGGETGPGPST